MKLNGEVLHVIGEDTVVIPRSSGDIAFVAQAVLDEEPFDKLFPRPEPPVKKKPDGSESFDIENTTYVEALNKWAEAKTDWLVLEAYRLGSPEITWDTVKMSEPETWGNYKKELKAAGFSEVEVARVIGCAISASGLDQGKIDRATESFLAKKAAQATE